jgi:DNA modification methylase
MCVTSPPYWGLRDYGIPGRLWPDGWFGVLGLEPTIDLYVGHIVEVFRQVRRVLKNDGTLWLNLGDSYATGAGKAASPGGGARGDNWQGPKGYRGAHDLSPKHTRPGMWQDPDAKNPNAILPLYQPNRMPQPGLKPKDLCMIPARVALALQADSWWLRSEIVWHKPNPMPESVTDRPTKSHEMLYLLSKSERYFYDADAIKEPCKADTPARYARGRTDHHKWADGGPGNQTIATNGPGSRFARSGNKERKIANGTEFSRLNTHMGSSIPWEDKGEGRNRRTVWTVPTKPFKGAHFATFPPKLIEPCILAGSRKCDMVLDPFGGAMTTAMVARDHGRGFTVIELNPEYVAIGRDRLAMAQRRPTAA